MRNEWFPSGIAEYVTFPELKTLRVNKVPMERDYGFGLQRRVRLKDTTSSQEDVLGDIKSMTSAESKSASAFQQMDIEKLGPERSGELLEIFVGPRIEFYRQPIIEEKAAEEVEVEDKKPEPLLEGSGAAAELMAARRPTAKSTKPDAKTGPTPIYGSVSALDVLQAVRATIARNDEAARVVLQEEDITFVDLPETEHSEAGKVKHIGDFTVEIKVRGSDAVIKRTVRIVPQEAS